jgi:sialic acid synthase SpsE
MFPALEAAQARREPLIVAELGARYAELDVMCAMVRAARDAGADMVKFQTYTAGTMARPDAVFTLPDGTTISQFEYFKRHELSQADHLALIAACKAAGVGWFSTPSHRTDLELLERLAPSCYKTGSDDLTNTLFLKAVAATGRPMLVSTGMCTLAEIEQAVRAIASTGNERLILLHCVVSYPASPADANLQVIETLRSAFGYPVGLSDHTQDDLTSILAAQLGAVVIEKHFTLDHALGLPDDNVALDPSEFGSLTRKVRLVRKALGSGVKRIEPVEESWRAAARKSLVAAREIAPGHEITEADLDCRRPADGLHPQLASSIVGRRARTRIPQGTPLDLAMF